MVRFLFVKHLSPKELLLFISTSRYMRTLILAIEEHANVKESISKYFEWHKIRSELWKGTQEFTMEKVIVILSKHAFLIMMSSPPAKNFKGSIDRWNTNQLGKNCLLYQEYAHPEAL